MALNQPDEHIEAVEFSKGPLQTELLKLQDKHPELFSTPTHQAESRAANFDPEPIEQEVRRRDWKKVLIDYGVDPSSISIGSDACKVLEAIGMTFGVPGFTTKEEEKRGQNRYFVIPIRRSLDTNIDLPKGYALKGGAARALLLRNTGIDTDSSPRDIDLVRLSKEEPYEGADHEISEKYMPDDYKTGYGVENISAQIASYFDSRDITQSEVLATSEHIICTKECLMDTVRRIIRPTEYEKYATNPETGKIKHKMLAKILRLYAENINRYGSAEIKDVSLYQMEESFIPCFWLALNLDRACERGFAVAETYVDILRTMKQIPSDIETPKEAADYLAEELYDFYYRFAPKEQFHMEEEWAMLQEEIEIADLKKRRKKIREKLQR